MPIFPDCIEDLDLIFTKLHCTDEVLEKFVEELTSYCSELCTYSEEFDRFSEEFKQCSDAALEYSEEMALFSHELCSRVKYDVHMEIYAEEFAWYSITAAALAEELELNSVEAARYSEAATEYSYHLEVYRDLLQSYTEES